MAMSRKHYREAAGIIKRSLPIPGELPSTARYESYRTAKQIAEGLADMFKADNSAFRREQFMEACGL